MAGRGDVLRAVAGEYAAIAAALGLPIENDAVTCWASPDQLTAAGRRDDLEAINRACVEALTPIKARARYSSPASSAPEPTGTVHGTP
jgi:hypothetical protein